MPKIKEVLDRSENYGETLEALGEALLKSSDLENRYDGLMILARRQKQAAKKFKRSDRVSFFLNMRDYYDSLAKAEMVREEAIDNATEIRDLQDGVKNCYILSSKMQEIRQMNELWGEESSDDDDDELVGDMEYTGDAFEGTEDPVDLSEPKKEEAPAPAPESAAAPAEPDIDDAS